MTSKIVVGRIEGNNFKLMCIFFGELVQNCEHAECQIVSTIRSLNETKLFKDNKSLPGGEEQRQQKIVSIANMVEEEGLHDPVYKVEEQEPASLGYQVEEPDASKSELYRWRV